MTLDGFDVVQMVHHRFEQSPELRLTLADAQLRWTIDVTSLQAALQALVTVGYLRRSATGVYSRTQAASSAPAPLF